MMGITKPRAPAPFSVVPSLAPDARTSAISTSSGGAGSPGAGLRLPPVSPRSPRSQNSDDRSPRERGLLGSPRRRRSLRTTATDLPEVEDRSPRGAVKELQKQRERRRSSVTFLQDDLPSTEGSPPPATQLSSSVKSVTLDDDATGSKVHYVPKKKKARSTASCTSAEMVAKSAVKEVSDTSSSVKKGGRVVLGVVGGSSRSERIEQASERGTRKVEKAGSAGEAAAAPPRRSSRDDGREGLGQVTGTWDVEAEHWMPPANEEPEAVPMVPPAIEEPEAEPDLEMWQLQERKLQAAMERVRMGLSALEVDPTEEEKREESQLQRELQEKNFTDRHALAYCLVKKLGSLSNAFKYLTSRQEKFSKVTWETALLVLHLHVVLLTGRNKNEIFQEMSEDDQTVTRESWDLYFAGIEMDGEGLPRLPVPPPTQPPTQPPAARRQPKDPKDSSAGSAKDQTELTAMEVDPVAPTMPADARPTVPVPSVSREEPPAARRRSLRREDTRKLERRRSSTRRPSGPSGPSAEKLESAPVELQPVEDEEEFLERISKMLQEMTPDCEVFNEGMTRQQKAVLMAKARERNLTAPAWKQGLLLLQEDQLSKKLREDMESLACGLSPVQVPRSLENFAGVIAEERGVVMTHRSSVDEDTLVIDMLKEEGSNEELLRVAEAFLRQLAEGEIRSLALPATSRFRSALVKVAKDLQLPSATAPDGHLQIGNLHVFLNDLDSIIDNLEEDQEHDFGPDLHLLQRQLVREKSIKAGLKVTEDDTVKIRRMAQFMLDSKLSLEEKRQLGGEAVFTRYATGRLAHQIFLRRSDLNGLLVDSPPGIGERLEDFRARIGQVFDDTLQLQLDVLGQNYGLSKEYFQVFLTKASNELSWRPTTDVLEAFMEQNDKSEPTYLT